MPEKNESRLENTAKEAGKPGFLGKITQAVKRFKQFDKEFSKKYKKAMITTAAAILMGAGYFCYDQVYARKGEAIRVQPDGKINIEYYRPLSTNRTPIKSIHQIEDIVGEIYYLDTGKKIEESKFRFNFWSKDKVPLHVKLERKIKGTIIEGINRDGCIYVPEEPLCYVLPTIFHEMGHGEKTKKNSGNEEPIAEWNATKAMTEMMYIDPDLYTIYDIYMRFNLGKSDSEDKNHNAKVLCQLRLANPSLEIKESYAPGEVEKIIEKETAGKTYNELLSRSHEGVLNLFKEKFSDRKDFTEKYAKIQAYIRYGSTDNHYDKDFIPKEELLKKVKEKEEFLKQEHTETIRANLEDSLRWDYEVLNEDEKFYQLQYQRIKRKGTDTEHLLAKTLDYAVKLNHPEQARELCSLIKKLSEKRNMDYALSRVREYEPLLSENKDGK